jgi:serine protease AprX
MVLSWTPSPDSRRSQLSLATVVAVEVAGRNGVVDVSTILQGMHWVSAYKDQFNIRVMNLSWGTASRHDPSLDPRLCSGFGKRASSWWWRPATPAPSTVMKPADDPLVLTVGAFDDEQNLDAADDSIPSWPSRGPTAAGLAKPDVVASDRFLTATRSFGSHVEAN